MRVLLIRLGEVPTNAAVVAVLQPTRVMRAPQPNQALHRDAAKHRRSSWPCVRCALAPRRASADLAGIISPMSPTVFREVGFRFYFFSREESRMHVPVQGQNGEAKFWLEPAIELAKNAALSQREINAALGLVKEHENDIRSAWHRHFTS